MNDGGPAFPTRYFVPHSAGGFDGRETPGMSLRDWFAGQAMTGYLAAHAEANTDFPKDELLAKWCYAAARAMLAERQKERPA